MKKLKTLFIKDPQNLGRVINQVNPDNSWVFTDGIPTQKFDGTSCAIINGKLYKRYDAKIDKNTGKYKRSIPDGAISCQPADKLSGHHPHWVLCNRDNNADRYHFEGFDALTNKQDGTYELCGPKVQGNPEAVNQHRLVKHGTKVLDITNFSFESLKAYLSSDENDLEGIVFHHKNSDQMCKIRKSDFGIQRIKKTMVATQKECAMA